MAEDFTRGLLKTLAVLRPYYLHIVVGGGWAPFLYYRYLTKNREHTPVLTRDIDFMVRHQVPLVAPITIDEILTKEADLTTAIKNLDNPPVIHYEGAIDGIEVEIEFLTEQTGSQEQKVLEVQKGLHAEALRYISIIVENTLLMPKARYESSNRGLRIHLRIWTMISCAIFLMGSWSSSSKTHNHSALSTHVRIPVWPFHPTRTGSNMGFFASSNNVMACGMIS